uniref:Uncharacterized protein n=1 Tax=Oryza rufipogon TaxID=4529 RepID=A0A0E0NR36_ORYRU
MDTPPSAAAATATAVASDSDCDSALVADVAEALVSASRLPEPPPIPALLALYLPRLAASHHPRVLSLAASHPGLASPDLLLAYRRHLSPPSCLPSLVPLLPVLPYRHLLPLLLSFVPLDPLRHLHRHLLAHLPTTQAGMVEQPPQIRSVRHLGLRVNYTAMVHMLPRQIEQILKSFPRLKSLKILRCDDVTVKSKFLISNEM